MKFIIIILIVLTRIICSVLHQRYLQGETNIIIEPIRDIDVQLYIEGDTGLTLINSNNGDYKDYNYSINLGTSISSFILKVNS